MRHVCRWKDAASEEQAEYRVLVLTTQERAAQSIQYRVGPRGLIPYISLQMTIGEELMKVSRVYVGPTQDASLGVEVTRGFLNHHYRGSDGCREDVHGVSVLSSSEPSPRARGVEHHARLSFRRGRAKPTARCRRSVSRKMVSVCWRLRL